MELHNHNPFSNITFLASFVFLLVLLKIVKRSYKHSNINLPPGPRPFPIIGNIPHVISNLLPHHQFQNMSQKYGPLMYLKLGELSHLVISSPTMAKEIMKTHDLTFCDRASLLLPTIFTYNASDIVFAQYGEHWREVRKLCVTKLLTVARVQSFRPIREEEGFNFVKSIHASEGSVVNLTQKIHSSTYGIVSRAAFGNRNKHQEAFIELIEEAVGLLGEIYFCDLFPSIKILQRMNTGKPRLEKLMRQTHIIFREIIEDHKNSHKEAKTKTNEDIVDVLLKMQQENNPQLPLTDDIIKAIIQDMFGAGSETSSTTTLWAMSEMIKNPKVMEEAQTEVRRVFDKKGYVDETDMDKLIYLKAVVKEALRLHPTVPLLLPRKSRESCQINGYDIPVKTMVAINIWAIGRNEKYWPEAESFKPERFVNSSFDYNGTDFKYTPFGSGRRMCPGIAFGMHNVELPLARLLYHFDWKLPNNVKNEDLDMTELSGLTLRRKNDLYAIPITRRLLPTDR